MINNRKSGFLILFLSTYTADIGSNIIFPKNKIPKNIPDIVEELN
jgi:hypothetical protein